MTEVITVMFIVLLLLIVIATIGASIIEEKEREENERVRLQLSIQDLLEENKKMREEEEFYIRLERAEQQRRIWEDIPDTDLNAIIKKVNKEREEERINKICEIGNRERQRKAARECLDRKRKGSGKE